MTDENLLKIFTFTCEENFDSGSFIIHQGELGSELFIIQSGSVEVLKSGRLGGKQHQLAVLAAGDSFGELALIDSGFRSASVRATQPTTVLVLTGIALDDLAHESDIIALIYRGLAFQLSGRLRFINEVATAALEQETKQFTIQRALATVILIGLVSIAGYAYYLGAKTCLANEVQSVSTIPKASPSQPPPVPTGL